MAPAVDVYSQYLIGALWFRHPVIVAQGTQSCNALYLQHPAMQVERFTFETPRKPGSQTPALKMAAKRYTIGSSRMDTDGVTLLLAHCIGSRMFCLPRLGR